MRWLLHNIHFRLIALLVLGFLIGLVWNDEVSKLHGCKLSSSVSNATLLPRTQSNALALKSNTESRDIPSAAKTGLKQKVNSRYQQQEQASQLHYSKGRKIILLNTVMAHVLPSHQNEQVKLNSGLMLNFFGYWTNGAVIAYTKNPALGGRRKHPRYFVLHRCDVAWR